MRGLHARLAASDGAVVLVCGWPATDAGARDSLAAAGSAKTLWYLTRGTGVVALLLLTASVLLGVASALRLRARWWPRFAVGDLHRNLTLLSIVFVGLHVGTTIADGFAPIGVKDAFIPFASPYRRSGSGSAPLVRPPAGARCDEPAAGPGRGQGVAGSALARVCVVAGGRTPLVRHGKRCALRLVGDPRLFVCRGCLACGRGAESQPAADPRPHVSRAQSLQWSSPR